MSALTIVENLDILKREKVGSSFFFLFHYRNKNLSKEKEEENATFRAIFILLEAAVFMHV
jgi:hypothetical protein